MPEDINQTNSIRIIIPSSFCFTTSSHLYFSVYPSIWQQQMTPHLLWLYSMYCITLWLVENIKSGSISHMKDGRKGGLGVGAESTPHPCRVITTAIFDCALLCETIHEACASHQCCCAALLHVSTVGRNCCKKGPGVRRALFALELSRSHLAIITQLNTVSDLQKVWMAEIPNSSIVLRVMQR